MAAGHQHHREDKDPKKYMQKPGFLNKLDYPEKQVSINHLRHPANLTR
jgi:hypothetical protein